MSAGKQQPKHGTIAASAAILVLAGWFATPVSAAPDRDSLCSSKTGEATLEISTATMSTTIEAVSDEHLLKPRVAAAARKVFAQADNKADNDEAVDDQAEEDEAEAPRLRPISDNKLVPVRRQMYRRDI